MLSMLLWPRLSSSDLLCIHSFGAVAGCVLVWLAKHEIDTMHFKFLFQKLTLPPRGTVSTECKKDGPVSLLFVDPERVLHEPKALSR